MNIKKRDGRIKRFNEERIRDAVKKSWVDVYGFIDNQTVDAITLSSSDILSNMNEDVIDIETVQNIVIKCIKELDEDVAKSYSDYRKRRSEERSKEFFLKYKREIIDKISDTNSNANVDENNFGGKQLRIIEDVLENIVNIGLPEYIMEDVMRGIIKLHDKSAFTTGMHNCLLIDYFKILKEYGIETRQGDTRPTKKYLTACLLLPVIIQSQSLDQFGGCGLMNFSIYMVEFLKHSIANKVKDYAYMLDLEIEVPNEMRFCDIEPLIGKAGYVKVRKFVDNEVTQAHQSLITNLVTLQSRSGHQLPFSSINLGLIDPDNEEESAYICEMMLKEIDKGIGKRNRTSIFPILCFQVKGGVNRYPSDKFYRIRKLAQEVSHRRLYPTFVNCDFSHNVVTGWGSEVNIMGCRTMLGYNRFTKSYDRLGRGNIFPTTINLPYIALEQGGDVDRFFDRLDDVIEKLHQVTLIRWDIVRNNPPSVAPFMYKNNTCLGSNDITTTVEEALKHGTFAIGYIGVAETVKAITGKYHNQSEEARKLGVEIVKRIKDACDKFAEMDNLNYSTYAAPSEGYCRQALDHIKRDFGVIDGISDKEYITNSHHCPVLEGVNVFDKIDIESEYAKYALGGNIFHIEVDGVHYNEKAITKAIDYALEKDIPYIRISHPIATCFDCGYTIGKYMKPCEACSGENVENLAIVTGYLSSDISHMNVGKQAEVNDRRLNINE